MFFFEIGNEYKNVFSELKFNSAFSFLHRTDLGELPLGWMELGNGVRASIQKYKTSKSEELKFETHDKYFDIQFLFDGQEIIEVSHREDLEVTSEYSIENDVTFYKNPLVCSKLFLQSGDLLIIGPEFAHKPRCFVKEPKLVEKIVIKVPV